MKLTRYLLTLLAMIVVTTASGEPRRWRPEMAATIHTWISSGSTAWSTAANWDTAAVPGSGGADLDTAICDGTKSQVSIAGEDRTADANLVKIITRTNYSGSIGSSGSPLIHSVGGTTKARVVHRGSGELYFSGVAAGASNVVVDGPGAVFLDGEINDLSVKTGVVDCADTCDMLGRLVLDGPGANVTIQAADSTELTPTPVIVFNGNLDWKRDLAAVTTVILFGGFMDMTGDYTAQLHLFVGPAARFRENQNQNSGGPFTLPNFVLGGGIDWSDVNYLQQPTDMVFSRLANILLAPTNQPPIPGGLDLDLREEYP